MRNQIQIFQNKEFGNLRIINISGMPWFVAKEVCEMLGIVNHKSAVANLDEDEKGVDSIYPLEKPKRGGGLQKMLIINESGLYTLIFQSRKPFAKAFRKWVTNEVLPNIRKTGCYKLVYPYEKRINHLERLREIDRNRLEILQSWILNVQAERDIYSERINSCTEIICTKDFSESENRAQLGKLLKSIRSEQDISMINLSKTIGDNYSRTDLMGLEQGKDDIPLSVLFKVLAVIGYSVQLVKNE